MGLFGPMLQMVFTGDQAYSYDRPNGFLVAQVATY